MLYNVYCDESCHLENDSANAMVLGAVWCPQERLKEINQRLKDFKSRHNVSEILELKWTKVSPAKIELYKDVINYFFDNKDLHFRALVIPDKSKLEHEKFGQTHDQWYYKMYFDMLKWIFAPNDVYEVYLDIKDTHSYQKAQKLRDVCSNSIYDFSHNIIKRLQPIRSEEVQIMQIVDLLIGAIGYENRIFPENFKKSVAKQVLIDLIKKRSGYTLSRTTLFKENKLNLFVWEASKTA